MNLVLHALAALLGSGLLFLLMTGLVYLLVLWPVWGTADRRGQC